jgi:membrane-associated phospholipid phosphatase
MRIRIKGIAYGLVAGTSLMLASPAYADREDWGKASDYGLEGLLITSVFIVPAFEKDFEGGVRAAGSIGAAWIVTRGLKHTVHEERPDGSDNLSFPSGHSSRSFAAAASLHKRYGWEIGIPAHAVAGFVGFARVKAKKHYLHDVIAGAAIGEAAGWLISQRKDSNVQWLPWGDTHGGGATVAYRF